jgi:hypothetical protein
MVLTLADILTTLLFLSLPPVEVQTARGTMVYSAQEYSGLVWSLISSSGNITFVCVKTILVGIIAIVLFYTYHRIDSPHQQGTIYGAVLTLCVMYVAVVVNNVQIILFLMKYR